MNVEASGLLSFFSALTGVEKLPDAWLQEGMLPEQFAAALNEQIAALTQNRQELPRPELPEGFPPLADFAGLSGKKLPTVGDDVDIDLEATLQALVDVLKTIETAPPPVEPLAPQAATVEGEVNGQPEADVELLLPDSAMMPNPAVVILPEPAKPTTTAKLPIVDVVKTSAADVAGADISERVENSVGTLLNTEKNEAFPERNERTAAASQANNAPLTEELQLSEAEDGEAVKKTHDSGREAAFVKVAADIGQMNRAVGGEVKAEAPPMVRHFAHPQWGNELADRVVWLHKQNIPSAELNLNPRHLGPISIRIDVNQEQTSIAFTAHHAVVKDAIEGAMPRLREMLGAQQLNLVNVDVSHQQSENRHGNDFFQMAGERRPGNGGQPRSEEQEPLSVAEEIEEGRAIASQGILSLFA